MIIFGRRVGDKVFSTVRLKNSHFYTSKAMNRFSTVRLEKVTFLFEPKTWMICEKKVVFTLYYLFSATYPFFGGENLQYLNSYSSKTKPAFYMSSKYVFNRYRKFLMRYMKSQYVHPKDTLFSHFSMTGTIFFWKCATRVLIMFWDNTIVIFKNFRYHRALFVPLMIWHLSSKKVMLLWKKIFSCCLKS